MKYVMMRLKVRGRLRLDGVVLEVVHAAGRRGNLMKQQVVFVLD